MDDSSIEELDRIDWEPLIKKLVAHADWKAKQKRWGRGEKGTHAGKEEKDFAFNAIASLKEYGGERNWNREREYSTKCVKAKTWKIEITNSFDTK